MTLKLSIALTILITSCTVLKKDPTKGNPPGTVQINDTLYIDQTEVGNVHWREYLYYLSDVEKNEMKYQDALPDTSVWQRDSDTIHNPLSEYYFRHPGYNNYPVVGISFEQAVEFCKWRTYVANQTAYFDQNKIKDFKNHLEDKFPIRFYYRLPTKLEWEMIATNGLSLKEFPYGYKNIHTKWRGKQVEVFNCLYPGKLNFAGSLSDPIYTTDLKSYFRNSFGCYNMIGNVAEMVGDKRIAKGGSFADKLDSCKISIDKFYDGPQMSLGFRCVAVKVK